MSLKGFVPVAFRVVFAFYNSGLGRVVAPEPAVLTERSHARSLRSGPPLPESHWIAYRWPSYRRSGHVNISSGGGAHTAGEAHDDAANATRSKRLSRDASPWSIGAPTTTRSLRAMSGLTASSGHNCRRVSGGCGSSTQRTDRTAAPPTRWPKHMCNSTRHMAGYWKA